MACAFALLSPTFTDILERVSEGESFRLFGLQLAQTSYASTVLPALIMVWALSHLEKFVRKRLPDVVKQLLTPWICFVVIVPLTLLIIGPISETVANAIASAYNFLYGHVPVLTAAIFGGLWEVLVIFGVHWGMNPVMLADLGINGNYTMGVYVAAAVAAQMGAVFGVAVKSKNRELKNMSASAGITAIFGITEPGIYGITLRLKKPFICGCLASAAACMIAGFMHSKGPLVPLEEISDTVFASGAMGPGIAIVPEEGKVYAPENGRVSMLFDTLHAIGFATEKGAELLIHVGMDTVKLEGKFFTAHTETGAQVKKGDLLLEFDMDKIEDAGYDLTTPIIVTNGDELGEILPEGSGKVEPGSKILGIR